MIRRLVLAICCIVAAGCGGDDGGEAYKARLLGTWTSAHPRYLDCLMTFQKTVMIFQADDGTLRSNGISDIDYTRDDNGHLLEIQMTEGGEDAFVMSVYVDSGPDGDLLRFKNQPQVIWTHPPTQ